MPRKESDLVLCLSIPSSFPSAQVERAGRGRGIREAWRRTDYKRKGNEKGKKRSQPFDINDEGIQIISQIKSKNNKQ